MKRDFTYIDDVIEGILRVIDSPPTGAGKGAEGPYAPYELFNIGNNSPVSLDEFVDTIEQACGRLARKKHLPMQPGDVPVTYADTANLEKKVGFQPSTSIYEGIQNFVEWYVSYH